MTGPLPTLHVNAERLWADFQALAAIGATPQGGINRPALSPAHLESCAWFQQRSLETGLETTIDGAGNHFARLSCGPRSAPALLLGSHLDSVPNGGRYDGALGVLAALEALRVIKEAGLTLPVNLEAVAFTDEEGTLLGLMGSRALAGKLSSEELQSPRGGRPALLEGLARAGLSEQGLLSARRAPETLAGYLELHIEQGPRLLQAGVQIGVVTGIVGIVSYHLEYTGRADHAGTTPVAQRLDAAQGAAAFILAARRLVLAEYPECVVNVGQAHFSPGAFNIVPERAGLALEFRSAEAGELRRLEAALLAQAQAAASDFGLELEARLLSWHAPAPMHPQAQAAILASAQQSGLSTLALASGAGHDAQSLAERCPCGMVFIPSQPGGSHSPREYSEWQDCLNGAQVLLGAALRMAIAWGGEAL